VTTSDSEQKPPVVEPAPIIKLPKGYVATNTEMVIRGAGMQVESEGKKLET
jgi:hypothetical protein